jgi:hypothetical protein
MDFVETQLNVNLLVDILEEDKKPLDKSIPDKSLKDKKNDKKPKDKNDKLKEAFQLRGPSCGLIVVDNFYNNAQGTRDYILTQEFSVKGNFPGQRTISYANEHLRDIIQTYVAPFGGRITDFPMPFSSKTEEDKAIYNGSFQYTTSRERSWIHADGWNNWAGVLYLTPDAPLSAGTAFYRFKNGEYSEEDAAILNTEDQTDKCSQDLTKWEQVDRVGNVFNRLILFNSKRFHMSMDYFGDTKENSRLFQVFFFTTER